jgi:hypothetical protein
MPTSIDFLNGYATRLNTACCKVPGSKNIYRNNRTAWTRRSEEVATEVIASFNLWTSKLYGFDACGAVDQNGIKHNFHVRVAYENENDGSWRMEMCKLCHVWSDLRVLVGYCDFRNGGEARLGDEIINVLNTLEIHENRITRMPTKWLFIFGPSKNSLGPSYPYVAYEFDPSTAAHPFKRKELVPLPVNPPVNPDGWQ